MDKRKEESIEVLLGPSQSGRLAGKEREPGNGSAGIGRGFRSFLSIRD